MRIDPHDKLKDCRNDRNRLKKFQNPGKTKNTMPIQTATLSYTRPQTASSSRELVLLEQTRWSNYLGLLTRVNLLRYLRAQFFPDSGEDEQESFVTCGFDADGGLTLGLSVYELAHDVRWKLQSSIGTTSPVSRITSAETQSVSFNMSDESMLNHPAESIISARWLTGPYDLSGNRISAPALFIDGADRRLVRAQQAVFGSVALRVQVQAAIYTIKLSAEAAEQALLAGWSESAVCLPEGGRPVALSLTAPPGAAELAESGQPCGHHISVKVTHNPGGPPSAQPEDKIINCDYCSLECDEE